MYIDKEGNIYKEQVTGVELTHVDIDYPSEPLEGFIGEIWFDERMHCLVDDRERAYWYKVENDALVKYDWKKRLEAGEFTLDDMRAKVLRQLKSNYQRDVQTTDSAFLLYEKRKTIGILEDGDEAAYQDALAFYKERTIAYRAERDKYAAVKDIDSLIAAFGGVV
jgi:hypothetical protein